MNLSTFQKTIRSAKNQNPTLVLKNANVVNVFTNEIIHADVAIYQKTIIGIGRYSAPREIDLNGKYLCPGFVDAHVHIESSMVTPGVFAQAVLPHGTTAVVADPHEIANVCGQKGIRFMLSDSKNSMLNVFFMLPSCVPATRFEHNGYTLDTKDYIPFLRSNRVLGLGEVMDYPAVIQGDESMLKKLLMFQNRPIDGHAPLLTGRDLAAYCAGGPFSDHECTSFEEILEKMRAGLRILLRVGSAANDMQDILKQIAQSRLLTENMMFCTDDKHIEDIQRSGHINAIAKMAVAAGIDPVAAVKMATINPCRAYGIPRRGAIAPGYIADLAVFYDLKEFRAAAVYAAGRDINEAKAPAPVIIPKGIKDSVHTAPLSDRPFALKIKDKMPVIEMPPGQLLTKLTFETVPSEDGYFKPGAGYVKLAVIERHHALGSIGIGILKNFGLKNGAIASTVAHDSHNLIAAGIDDHDMLLAVRALQECGGGYAAVSRGKVIALLELPVAGLMSNASIWQTLRKQKELLRAAYSLGLTSDPFIPLSFLALPVIPEVRVTDMGVFDVIRGKFI